MRCPSHVPPVQHQLADFGEVARPHPKSRGGRWLSIRAFDPFDVLDPEGGEQLFTSV